MSTPDGDVRGLVAHVRAVADLDHQGVEVDDRVERLQGPGLPGHHLLGDGLGDLADRLVGQLGAERAARWCWMSRIVIPPAYRR
jgi:hypothetical protein